MFIHPLNEKNKVMPTSTPVSGQVPKICWQPTIFKGPSQGFNNNYMKNKLYAVFSAHIASKKDLFWISYVIFAFPI